MTTITDRIQTIARTLMSNARVKCINISIDEAQRGLYSPVDGWFIATARFGVTTDFTLDVTPTMGNSHSLIAAVRVDVQLDIGRPVNTSDRLAGWLQGPDDSAYRVLPYKVNGRPASRTEGMAIKEKFENILGE